MTIECWTVGFIGRGDVTKDNAEALLDVWLSQTAEIQAVLPERIPRNAKGLKAVEELLEAPFRIPSQGHDPDNFLDVLKKAKAEGEEVFLIILGTEDETAVKLAGEALEAGIPVKDLCTALFDDVTFEDETPAETTAEPKTRGRPRGRGKTVQAEVAGPAIVAPVTLASLPSPPTDLEKALADLGLAFLQVIRHIVREEAVFPGVHAHHTGPHAEPKEPDEGRTIRAFVDADGKYRKALRSNSKPKDGEEEVMLTAAEAREAGLLD